MNLGGVIHLNRTSVRVLLVLILLLVFYSLSDKTSEDIHQNADSKLINLHNLLEVAIKASENGGKEVVDFKDHLNLKSKGLTKEGLQDSLTLADLLSHCSMIGTLKHFFPKLKVVSEEAKSSCDSDQVIDFNIPVVDHLPNELFDAKDVTVWIDPLDATYEYAEQNEKLYQFVTTMVCVAVKGKPVVGVIHKPFNRTTTWAWVEKSISRDLNRTLLPQKSEKLKIIVSRSHRGEVEKVLHENFKQQFQLIIAAGAGYKALEVAYGNVDAYIHITEIKKWDICAGNAIVNALGGKMTTRHNEEIDYSDNKYVRNQDGLITTLSNHELFLGNI